MYMQLHEDIENNKNFAWFQNCSSKYLVKINTSAANMTSALLMDIWKHLKSNKKLLQLECLFTTLYSTERRTREINKHFIIRLKLLIPHSEKKHFYPSRTFWRMILVIHFILVCQQKFFSFFRFSLFSVNDLKFSPFKTSTSGIPVWKKYGPPSRYVPLINQSECRIL